MVKGMKIDKGRIECICKDMKRVTTCEGLRKFLLREVDWLDEHIREELGEYGDYLYRCKRDGIKPLSEDVWNKLEATSHQFKFKNMAKYNYWHIITKISKEYSKSNPNLKLGFVITHPYKKDNEGIAMFNLVKGKVYHGAYVLSYLGRLEKSLPGEETADRLTQLAIEKGYGKLLKKGQEAMRKLDKEKKGVRKR